MSKKNLWYVEPKGSITQRAIINALNFVTDIVYNTIVLPNRDNIEALKTENEQLKKQTSEDNDSILDLDYRVTMLEG